jgi:hypothetical protein
MPLPGTLAVAIWLLRRQSEPSAESTRLSAVRDDCGVVRHDVRAFAVAWGARAGLGPHGSIRGASIRYTVVEMRRPGPIHTISRTRAVASSAPPCAWQNRLETGPWASEAREDQAAPRPG